MNYLRIPWFGEWLMREVGGPGTEPPSDWPEDGRGGMGTFCGPAKYGIEILK